MEYIPTKTYNKLKDKAPTNFPTHVFIHHSGGTEKNAFADTSHHTAEIMEAHHLSLGWEGLGYQYVIEKDGKIRQGRPEHYHGAHAGKEWNNRSIGICLAGNFDVTLPVQEQVTSLKYLLQDILKRHPTIKKENILPHRKSGNTSKSCYGRLLTDTWAKNLVEDTSVTTPPICLPYQQATTQELISELLRRIMPKK